MSRRFAASCLALFAVLAMASTATLAQRIVIDPGHGGNDPGGTGTGMEEKEVVLDTGLRFRDLLQADTADDQGGGSWTVSLTRDTDTFVSLAARSAYANSIDADRFMSIHANAFGNASANGTETFSYAATGTSADLRNLVQEEMISAWGLTDRGNKTAGFSVLVNTAMPAELHELAFITNATDASKLASSASRQTAAMAHLRALQRHYGLEAYAPGAVEIDSGDLLVAVRSDSSTAMAGVSVAVDGSAQGQTDEAGELLIEDLAVGSYLVAVTAPGFLAGEQTVEIIAGDVASVLFELVVEPEGEDPNPGVGSTNCDSQQAECTPPVSDIDGGCSTPGTGTGSGLALALLLLALMSHAHRRNAAARCRPIR